MAVTTPAKQDMGKVVGSLWVFKKTNQKSMNCAFPFYCYTPHSHCVSLQMLENNGSWKKLNHLQEDTKIRRVLHSKGSSSLWLGFRAFCLLLSSCVIYRLKWVNSWCVTSESQGLVWLSNWVLKSMGHVSFKAFSFLFYFSVFWFQFCWFWTYFIIIIIFFLHWIGDALWFKLTAIFLHMEKK